LSCPSGATSSGASEHARVRRFLPADTRAWACNIRAHERWAMRVHDGAVTCGMLPFQLRAASASTAKAARRRLLRLTLRQSSLVRAQGWGGVCWAAAHMLYHARMRGAGVRARATDPFPLSLCKGCRSAHAWHTLLRCPSWLSNQPHHCQAGCLPACLPAPNSPSGTQHVLRPWSNSHYAPSPPTPRRPQWGGAGRGALPQAVRAHGRCVLRARQEPVAGGMRPSAGRRRHPRDAQEAGPCGRGALP